MRIVRREVFIEFLVRDSGANRGYRSGQFQAGKFSCELFWRRLYRPACTGTGTETCVVRISAATRLNSAGAVHTS
jgi:hypothetical protein